MTTLAKDEKYGKLCFEAFLAATLKSNPDFFGTFPSKHDWEILEDNLRQAYIAAGQAVAEMTFQDLTQTDS